MKKIYIPLISLIAIIALLLIGLMVSMMNSGSWSGSWNFSLDGNLEVVSDSSYAADGIENINMDISSDSLDIFLNDTEEIRVIEYMLKSRSQDELAIVDISGDTFELRKEEYNFINFNFNSKIEVYLPKSYLKNLEAKTASGSIKLMDDFSLADCKISSSSGSIKTNQIKAENVEMYTTSGSIKAEDTINSKSADFKSSSGSINIYEVTTETINAETTSGSIRSDNAIIADTVSASSSSGSINFNNVTGIQNFSSSSGTIDVQNAKNGGSYETTSGSIRLNFEDVTDNITCSSSSGSVRIDIPNEESFNFKGKASSGSVHTFFENFSSSNSRNDKTAKVGENPEFDINISTTSGSIHVD